MPYSEMPEGRYIREQAKSDPRGFLPQWEIAQLIESKYEDRVIGRGAECIVVPVDGDNEKVAAYYYNQTDPEEAKRTFYFQRIFSTLFPNNFPHFYAAFGNEPESRSGISGTVRARIEGMKKPYGPEEQRAYYQKIHYPFERVLEELKEMGVELRLDPARANFIAGSNGGEYYVDTIHNPSTEGFDPERIKAYMTRKNYSKMDIRVVEKSLQRLQALKEETEKR